MSYSVPGQAYQARQTNYVYGSGSRGRGGGRGSAKGSRGGGQQGRYRPLPMSAAPAAQPPRPSAPAPMFSASSASFAPHHLKAEPLVKLEPQAMESDADPAAEPKRQWTDEELRQAKANATDAFDAPLNETGKRRARVSVFNGLVGVDLREYFEGTYGDAVGRLLPSGRGIRLRIEEWEALKAASGDIDAAVQDVLRAPKTEGQ